MARGAGVIKITVVRDGVRHAFVRLGDRVVSTRHISMVQNNPRGGCTVIVDGNVYDCPETSFSELARVLEDVA